MAAGLMHGPADAADSNEEKKADAEPNWVLSGILNRALLLWDDGEFGITSVDNPQDTTGILLEGNYELGNDWSIGADFGIDASYASADTVDQLDLDGDGAIIELTYAFGKLAHEKLGEIVIGQADSASDDIDNINLAESDAVSDASGENWIDEFFLRAAGISGDSGLATGKSNAFNAGDGQVRWGDFIDGNLGGESGRFITYISPEVRGFEFAAAVGQPQEIFLLRTDDFQFNDKTGGVYWDLGLRYSGEFGKAFRIEGGIGYWMDTSEEKGAEEPTEDMGAGGSFAIRHLPTGLNVAVNYADESHTDDCADPGEVSEDCRGDDRVLYLKGGIVRDIVKLGPTAFYGEYHKNWKAQNESDEDVLRTLERFEDKAMELKSSEVVMWGAGIVQHFNSVRPSISAIQMYFGYRHYELDVDLLGDSGPVAARNIEDVDVFMGGLTIHWGGAREDRCPPVCEPAEEEGGGEE
jgi:hypothetical protein